jgi:two-component system, LytTR family, response regulator AlgR
VRGFERSAPEAGETHWLVLLAGVDEKLAVSRRQQHIVRELGKG